MDPWQRVAEAIRDRRLTLRRTQQEMSEAAGVSLATWRLLETAGRERYQGLTLRGVTSALGWTPDAIDRLLAGDAAPAELTADPSGPDPLADLTAGDDVPVGFARRWRDLTPEERAKVLGFVDGLVAGRGDDAR